MNAEKVRELLELALNDDADDESSSEAFRALQRLEPRSQLYELCESLLVGQEPERDLATGLLISFAKIQSPFHTRALDHLYDILDSEYSPPVLAGAILALAHFQLADAVEKILPFCSHDDEEVRLSVVKSISRLASEGEWSARPELLAQLVEAMVQLTADYNVDVREWATFAFRNDLSEVNSPEIINALETRLSDDEDCVRDEAICALACRNDKRVVPFIEARLSEGTATETILEAVQLLDDPRLNALAEQSRR